MQNKEDIIYGLLCDDESKRVFEARRHYSKTGDQAVFGGVFCNAAALANAAKQLAGKKFIIYGAGAACNWLIAHFDLIGVGSSCVGLWDNNSALHGKAVGNYVVSKPDYDKLCDVDIVLIATTQDEAAKSIYDMLLLNGLSSEAVLKVEPFGYTLGRLGYENHTMYFDEEIISFSDDEVFVDGGSCDFGTSMQLLKLNPHTKRIYAIEPDYMNKLVVERAIDDNKAWHITTLLDCALWSDDQELGFYVNEAKGGSSVNVSMHNSKVQGRKLDDIILPEDKVTFIKLDVEGSEIEALKGASRIIKQDKPKLAISVYHKPDDYFEIPSYILELMPEYRMYMRHYTPWHWETVLYCV